MMLPLDLFYDLSKAPIQQTESLLSSQLCSREASPQGSSICWIMRYFKSKYNKIKNPINLITHPPETASTVTLIGIPGFCPSGASRI